MYLLLPKFQWTFHQPTFYNLTYSIRGTLHKFSFCFFLIGELNTCYLMLLNIQKNLFRKSYLINKGVYKHLKILIYIYANSNIMHKN